MGISLNSIQWRSFFATVPLLCLTFSLCHIEKPLAQASVSPSILASDQTVSTCPADLTTLTSLMLKDLPSYANRVIQRQPQSSNSEARSSYVILAGKAEFQPLKLNVTEYNPIEPDSSKQVFFTTLERKYQSNQVAEIQNYHWLFLVQTSSGWEMLTILSSRSNSNGNQPSSPPEETTNSTIGQTVSLWLKDCNAGAIKYDSNDSK